MIKKRRAFIFFLLLALLPIVNAIGKSNEIVWNKQVKEYTNFSLFPADVRDTFLLNTNDTIGLNLIDSIQSEPNEELKAEAYVICFGGGVDPQFPGGDAAFNRFVQEIDISDIDLSQLTEENNVIYLQFYINEKGEINDL